mmetsp:Transcript_29710/g.38855  ORF Transcript_29710/g.38855 Transcript_29710/m.38855 type:complete len:123 (+) Transcript_29710:266-634(+)|eukprot:CAMPEP_0195257952 /NCGR_PEP_ID=MMETSP0706-20130129/7108_1 /TAXON_ID=33640 /ORGANISM="Asterionellopsis glacialis, Strain CCMP134" /LENGTH=122 /DNA_ID=CAMNT_0040311225 /DNA_START=241 /DNA_END=609 /DNA_ORIENTATION=-
MRFSNSLLLLVSQLLMTTSVIECFLPPLPKLATFALRNPTSLVFLSKPDDQAPIECYLTNEEEVVIDGETPQVICTSEPEEYAWFNGIDPDKMKKTDGMEEGKLECVEGSSPRGVEEWECQG